MSAKPRMKHPMIFDINVEYGKLLYEKKLIRIRNEIEDYLRHASSIEKDDLAVALAAGRYASMKLAQLTGEHSTKKFFNECIKTTLN